MNITRCPRCRCGVYDLLANCPGCDKPVSEGERPAINVEVVLSNSGIWFFDNPPVVVYFDSVLVGTGTTREGFNIRVNTCVGEHNVSFGSRIHLPFSFPSPGAYHVRLDYSRWSRGWLLGGVYRL